jgi:hypothetical protein
VVRLLVGASQTRANDARKHHGRWSWRNHQVGIFTRRLKSRALHAKAHSRVWPCTHGHCPVDHDDITEPKGSITVRHSPVRPTFHSGQYGLSHSRELMMARTEQTKNDLGR